MNPTPTPTLVQKFHTLVRSGFWYCCACQQTTTEPKDYGEANLQRCPNCDSARLSWNPPVIQDDEEIPLTSLR